MRRDFVEPFFEGGEALGNTVDGQAAADVGGFEKAVVTDFLAELKEGYGESLIAQWHV